MSRIAHASGTAAIVVMIAANTSAEPFPPSLQRGTCVEVHRAPSDAGTYPATPVAKFRRIRSLSEATGKILDQGYERSLTFRGLVEILERAPVLVYVEPGRCPAMRRQRLNGCLADLGTAGGIRHLRVMVDVRLPTDYLIATVGHELQHAVEAGESNTAAVGHQNAFIGAAARPVGPNVYETDAAQDVKGAILQDLRHARPGCAVPTAAVPPA